MDSEIKPTDREYWYNSDKMVIVGFSRSGQTALSRYLHCSMTEIAPNGTKEYLEKYYPRQPIIITRNPVDRIWSAYNYHGMFKNMSFEDFLDFKDERWQGVSCNDVIAMSDYEKYIEPYREFDVKVYRLEDMMDKPGFSDWRGKSDKKIPKEYRDMIESRLKEREIVY
jgi:hypothetical protein